jgi:hypothetical protein
VARIRNRLTYANVMATLAVAIAIAGGTAAVAGVRVAPKNSVTTKSIRAFNVTARDLTGLSLVKQQQSFTKPGVAAATAVCSGGSRLISGGGGVVGGLVTNSAPAGNAWSVAGEGSDAGTATVSSFAICLANKPQKPQPGIP